VLAVALNCPVYAVQVAASGVAFTDFAVMKTGLAEDLLAELAIWLAGLAVGPLSATAYHATDHTSPYSDVRNSLHVLRAYLEATGCTAGQINPGSPTQEQLGHLDALAGRLKADVLRDVVLAAAMQRVAGQLEQRGRMSGQEIVAMVRTECADGTAREGFWAWQRRVKRRALGALQDSLSGDGN